MQNILVVGRRKARGKQNGRRKEGRKEVGRKRTWREGYKEAVNKRCKEEKGGRVNEQKKKRRGKETRETAELLADRCISRLESCRPPTHRHPLTTTPSTPPAPCPPRLPLSRNFCSCGADQAALAGFQPSPCCF